MPSNSNPHEVTPELLMFFGRMEAKLDTTLEWIRHHEKETEKGEDRLSKLEQLHARYMGLAAGISLAISTAAGILSYTLVGGGQ
jgi:hypothetical protein